MLDTITRLLRSIEGRGSFASRETTAARDLRLEVNGVGAIRLPVSAKLARGLCRIARPARFGSRDQTLMDKDVRDTWEIARSRVKVDERRWKQTLEPQLEKIKVNLGLPATSRLVAQLYKLLVYEPGQFFVSHQDSEKADEMIGTLAVVLPSTYRGGTEVIEHRGEKVTYRRTSRSAKSLTFIAFYADCHHEVRPVTEGFRVVLLYNLLIREGGTSRLQAEDAGAIDSLAKEVATYFEALVSEYSWQAPEPPEKLVYLLDHDYTQRSLTWHRLKRVDASRAAALRAVAERLDCEAHLALADIHESWSCEEDSYAWGYRAYNDYYDDDEDEEEEELEEDDGLGQHEDLLLTELLDSGVELRHLLDTSGKVLGPRPCYVPSTELCYTKVNSETEPFRSEHEPWMGNYGNTVDRWYHRAAVVLWPRSRTFSIRAKIDPVWAVDELARLLRKSTPCEARAQAQSLLSCWRDVVSQAGSRRLLSKTMRVVSALGDRELAASLLEPFALEHVGPASAPPLAGLLDAYGVPWCWELFLRWDGETHRFDWDHRQAWYERMPELCEVLCAKGAQSGRKLAQRVVAHEWGRAGAACAEALEDPNRPEAGRELATIGSWLIYVLESSVEVGRHDVHGDIVRFLIADDTRFPDEALVAALRECRGRHPPKELKHLGLGELLEHGTSRLAAVLAAPKRSVDDWTIEPPMKCACGLCETLGQFLASEDRIRLEWPLAKDKRRHVHQQIDRYDLPVSHATKREGRPFKLMLSKRKALFTREAERREQRKRELAWLKRQRRVFV